MTKGTLLQAEDATLGGVDLSDTPSAVPAGHQAEVDDPLIDEERRKKIAALRQAVAKGTYHVTPEQLADKLIDQMLEPKA